MKSSAFFILLAFAVAASTAAAARDVDYTDLDDFQVEDDSDYLESALEIASSLTEGGIGDQIAKANLAKLEAQKKQIAAEMAKEEQGEQPTQKKTKKSSLLGTSLSTKTEKKQAKIAQAAKKQEQFLASKASRRAAAAKKAEEWRAAKAKDESKFTAASAIARRLKQSSGQDRGTTFGLLIGAKSELQSDDEAERVASDELDDCLSRKDEALEELKKAKKSLSAAKSDLSSASAASTSAQHAQNESQDEVNRWDSGVKECKKNLKTYSKTASHYASLAKTFQKEISQEKGLLWQLENMDLEHAKNEIERDTIKSHIKDAKQFVQYSKEGEQKSLDKSQPAYYLGQEWAERREVNEKRLAEAKEELESKVKDAHAAMEAEYEAKLSYDEVLTAYNNAKDNLTQISKQCVALKQQIASATTKKTAMQKEINQLLKAEPAME